MITIVSSSPAERSAFVALCESRGWPHLACDSVRAFRAFLGHTEPSVVLMRNRLDDGYSDDVLAALKTAGMLPATRTIVLIAAGTPASQEARQVALGADCVHRDPARIDVLMEYLARYRTSPGSGRGESTRRSASVTFAFAGATIDRSDRKAEHKGKAIRLTPRELSLAELLAERHDEVISYHAIYAELLGRQFAGDTSNMRVLLRKLGQSMRTIGVDVREWVEVIPKSGYRYHAARALLSASS